MNNNRLISLGVNFAALKPFEPLLLAVSGGSDSMALLRLCEGKVKFTVATVDHGLRKESEQQCLQVKQWCLEKNIPCEILTWQGEKPVTGLQNAARNARYDLLITHANLIGAKALVTAHTLNDQAETLLMRLIKGTSPAGMAGIKGTSKREGLTLLRPFLWVEKQDLQNYLNEQNQAWLEDPSNHNDKFTRVRIRTLMQEFAAEGLTSERLGRFAARQSMQNDAIEFYANELITKMGETRLEAKLMLQAPFAVTLKALSLLIEQTGDKTIAEKLEKLEELAVELLTAIASNLAFHATLRGAKLTLTPNGILRLTKELPRAIQPAPTSV